MQPVVAKLERKCAGDIVFIHADVDQSKYRALASEYRVNAIPRFVLLNPAGKVVKQWAGTTSAQEFDKQVAQICAGTP
jgi:thioredoxin-related protein